MGSAWNCSVILTGLCSSRAIWVQNGEKDRLPLDGAEGQFVEERMKGRYCSGRL